MPARISAPIGAPCWTDLWTSDVEGSRRFYGELFGWEAGDPDPEFGGYFIFKRDGVDIAGGMGDMGEDMPADNSWKIYLATDDITKTAESAVAHGAQIVSPAMAVADLGTQLVMTDPTGATLAAWQADQFPGFTVVLEHGTPGWFELHSGDFASSVDFYRSVFHWDTVMVGDSDEFRYTTMGDPMGGENLAGIMDASGWLPGGGPARWSVYWQVDDVDHATDRVRALGGAVTADPVDTPYGRLATVADPVGAEFKLRAG
jgi:predicted enzyme related to lactoylglutathione lyase